MLYINGIINVDLTIRFVQPFNLESNKQENITYTLISSGEMHNPNHPLDYEVLEDFYKE